MVVKSIEMTIVHVGGSVSVKLFSVFRGPLRCNTYILHDSRINKKGGFTSVSRNFGERPLP